MRRPLMLLIAAAAVLACSDSTAPFKKPSVIDAQAVDTVAVGTTGTITLYVVSATFDTLDRVTILAKTTDSTIAKASGDSITGVKIGSTIVSFFALDTLGVPYPGVEADVLVEVVPQTIASLALSLYTDTLAVPGTVNLTASALDAAGSPSSGHTISWVSSNKSVATVSVTGKVTAVAAGIARITAFTDGGVSATATITVTGP